MLDERAAKNRADGGARHEHGGRGRNGTTGPVEAREYAEREGVAEDHHRRKHRRANRIRREGAALRKRHRDDSLCKRPTLHDSHAGQARFEEARERCGYHVHETQGDEHSRDSGEAEATIESDALHESKHHGLRQSHAGNADHAEPDSPVESRLGARRAGVA